MYLSIIQRIVLGFVTVIIFVIALSTTAYISQSDMAEQFDTTSVKMTSLLARANHLGQNLQNLNRALLVHASTADKQLRIQLEQEFNLAQQEYLNNRERFISDLNAYPNLQASVNELDAKAQDIFANALLHIDVKNQQMSARQATSKELNEFDKKWRFFEQDISDLAHKAKANNQRTNNRNLNYIVAQGKGADRYLQKTYAMENMQDAEVARQELIAHIERFKSKAKRLPKTMPESKPSIDFYQGQLIRAIEQPEGLLQQHLTYIRLTAQSNQLLSQIAYDMNAVINEFDAITEQIQLLVSDAASNAKTTSENALLLNGSLALACTLIAVLVAWTIVYSIKRPLAGIVKALDKMTNGDLTFRIDTGIRSELGTIAENINSLAKQLSEIISQVQQSATTLSDVANESHILSNKTNIDVAKQQKQTTAIEQAVNEMKQAIDTVTISATETRDEVKKINDLAHGNMKSMHQNLEFGHQLQTSLAEATEVIHQLSDESRQIGEILTVIQSISEQTNLLALNAAIEAARAGEQGRGFAVVADEVRSLATHTQNSANDIGSMIDSLQSKAAFAVTLVENNLEQAAVSVSHSNESNHALENMVARLSTIKQMSRSIANESEKQSEVVKDVVSKITYISDKATRIAEEVDESARNSESLNQLSSRQSELVSHFVILN
ncbi:methyl-accepting chemotaxis protein [Vibrio mexicanus]|uniref:methyl-accepting chemotaxis protein n=1 Tax=Vibrio mexicanus TaxID=1004326 RepID=UPI00063C73F1|nr:methyl-accepting chemotaxis protein [Vibrio mexicanus]